MSRLDKCKALVLNADGMPVSIISWKRAICLVMENRVTQLEFYHNIHATDGKGRHHPVPAVVSLNKYIRRDYRRAPFCRKNVLLRDACICAYCCRKFLPADLTLDHVVPRSRWRSANTPTSWENIVTCCIPCNRRKADKSCDEVAMFPRTRPTAPSYGELFVGLNPHRDRTPPEWMPYLSHLPLYQRLTHYEPQAAV
jgi:5-methylcytosine-specific restriction endonuclease McrA